MWRHETVAARLRLRTVGLKLPGDECPQISQIYTDFELVGEHAFRRPNQKKINLKRRITCGGMRDNQLKICVNL
jgi:hypothetical protein